MAEQEITIQISTEVDDSSLESLNDTLQQLTEQGFEINIDSSPIEDVANSAEDAATSLGDAADSAEELGNNIPTGNGFEEVADGAENTSDSLDNANQSNNALTAGASALAGVGLASTLLGWADSSGNVASQWSRMGLAMQSTGLTAEQVQQKYSPVVSQIADDTGRAGGQIREFFIQMAGAGVTNSKILTDSFEGIAGAAYVTGHDVNNLGEMFTRLTMTGKLVPKQLATNFKLNLSDIGSAMRQLGYDVGNGEEEIKKSFADMDANTRAKVLGTALSLKGGAKANEQYKQSWDGMKQQADKASAGLFKFAGDLLLPTLIPALQLATGGINKLTGAFRDAPKPVQSILGVLGTLSAGFIVLVLAISSIRSAWSLLQIGKTIGDLRNLGNAALHPIQTLQKLKVAVNGVGPATRVEQVKRSFQNLGQTVTGVGGRIKSTLSGVGQSIVSLASNAGSKLKTLATAFADSGKQALIAAGTYVKNGLAAAANAVRTGIMTAATWLATAAQTALNFVMAINPIFLVIMAVAALVAALVYLYYNNEQVRNAVNALGNGLKMVGQIIYGALIGAWNALKAIVMNVVNSTISCFNTFKSNTMGVVNAIIGAWNKFKSGVNNAINAVKGFIEGLVSKFEWLKSMVMPLIQPIIDGINAIKSGWDYVTGSGGSPWEVTHNNGYAGSPFEETGTKTQTNNNNPNGNTYIFKSLYMDKDFANHVINVIDRRDELERMRTGA
ncbi:hypothetical protein SDC9_07412 [bioreactor metagenome]|uniref:Phage tail tape measure protein domain-containing protein n=1 Tax=bioreactor metagenome TaxID=1076179 RepID=A0A644T4H2_9ZZZZ|nr:hypothetical protein [Methanobrevibacter sp.]MEA4956867.1 hypothetical protein [Methanobrevibacter sp.]